MPWFNILTIFLAVALVAALAAFSVYGRFARRAEGADSHALPVEPDKTSLDRTIAPLLDGHAGETGLMLLSDNLDAFEKRVLAVRNAGRSLDLQYYYWLEDLTGNLLAQQVVAAADRGVRVRLLIDDINTRGNDKGYLLLDSHPNIEVRLFNPSRNRANGLSRGLELALRAFRTTRRMHNKAWIVDGRVAIVGGRNIGNAYFDASPTTNFHDMDLLFIGEALPAVQSVFDDFWNSPTAIPIRILSRPLARMLPQRPHGPRRRSPPPSAEPYLRRLAELDDDQGLAAIVDKLIWTDAVEIVSDPPEKAWAVGQQSWLARKIYRALATTQRELNIVSPYFIPGDRGVTALNDLTGRGAAVSVLTNSLAATDVVAAHGAYSSYRKRLLQGGVKLFELRADTLSERASLFGSKGASLHTKAFTVDGTTGFIGSFNFDPRSASLNTEMGVLFAHPPLVAQVNAVIARQTQVSSAFQVKLISGRVAWVGDLAHDSGPSFREPHAGIWRRLAAGVICYLPVESQL